MDFNQKCVHFQYIYLNFLPYHQFIQTFFANLIIDYRKFLQSKLICTTATILFAICK